MKINWNDARRTAVIIFFSVVCALGGLYLKRKLLGEALVCRGFFARGIEPQALGDFLVVTLVAFVGLYLFDRYILKK
ncbi:MAG: hypothetical protein QG604_808 [Candidatus Dependentiae bacterium]|nr:hypothetical protein [Candidatus Dependentiae bacterium]